MANTLIKIKRSTSNTTPADGTLSAGELAYSYNSNILYLGTANSANVTQIGGYYWINQIVNAYDKANLTYTLTYDIGASSNAWSNTKVQTITSNSNSRMWANTVTLSNGTKTVFVDLASSGVTASSYGGSTTIPGYAVDAYGRITRVDSYSIDFSFATTTSNGWANTVATAGNNYTRSVGAASNTWANSVGVAANNYSNATFVKLIAGSQTITGDLAVTGNLVLLGNATSIVSNNLIVGDSLIYLAANNYTGTDILDIGFVANYANATSHNVHTGLIRDATTKQYYLFQGLDIELQSNNRAFTFGSNGSSYAILNTDLAAGNITLSGINVYPWIIGAYDTANNRLANVVAGAPINVIWTTTNGHTNATINISTSGVTAATYGGPTQIPSFVVDSYGRITSASNVSVQGMDYAYANQIANSVNSWSNNIVSIAFNQANAAYDAANAGSLVYTVRTVNSNYTIVRTDELVISNAPNSVSLTLPVASSNIGYSLQIKNINTGNVTILPDGADTIDGFANLIIQYQYSAVGLISTGTNWVIF